MTASRQTTLVLSLISTLSQCEPYGCNAQCICKCHSHTYSLKVGMTVHSFSAVLYLQDRCLLVHFFWGARARLLLPAAVSSSDMSGSEQRGVFIKPRVAWSEGKKKKKNHTHNLVMLVRGDISFPGEIRSFCWSFFSGGGCGGNGLRRSVVFRLSFNACHKNVLEKKPSNLEV